MLFRVYYADGGVYESPVLWKNIPSTGVQVVVIWEEINRPQMWDGLDAYWSDEKSLGGFLDMPPFNEVALKEEKAGRLKWGQLISDQEYAIIWEKALLDADNPPSA
jgi:hypothetical protein